MRGGQIGLDHAGRSDRRAGSVDAASLRAEERWTATKAAWRRAYLEPSASPEERHRREVAYAFALARYRAACQRLRRCEAAYGAPAPDA